VILGIGFAAVIGVIIDIDFAVIFDVGIDVTVVIAVVEIIHGVSPLPRV
jgi:hypothetical protein